MNVKWWCLFLAMPLMLLLNSPFSANAQRQDEGRPASRRHGGLHIVAAAYGARDRMIDVRRQLQSLVQDGRLELQVTNESMGGDPFRGERKVLQLTYQWEGREYDITVPEGQSFSIPNDRRRGGPDGRHEGAQQDGLTGFWQDNSGGHYLIRQVGNRIYWVDDGRPKYLNVFVGTARGRMIDGEWADLPGGQLDNSGTLQLRIESNDRLVKTNSGGVPFGGSVFTRSYQER
jgi:DnaJ-like protein C11, C-terminal